MKIGIGRKQLVISVRDIPADRGARAFDIPSAVDANDSELAHLNATINLAQDRTRWGANALFYGAFHLLES